MIRYIDELKKDDLKGKVVLLRLDLNVPVNKEGEVLDAYRLEKAIDTVDFLRTNEAKTIIISHCESNEPNQTLVPMWHYLNGYFPIEFCKTYFDAEATQKILNLKEKGVLMFENLRINTGEKENSEDFSKKLAQMADIYVNDAFAVSHREHASIVGVPKLLPHYAGFLMRAEVENLSHAFNPKKPFVFILGGAKFDTKLPLIKKYLDSADAVFVGGALANDAFKAEGLEVGISVVSKDDFGIKEMIKNSKFVVPVDVTVLHKDGSSEITAPNEVLKDDFIMDVGDKSLVQLEKLLKDAKTVVWNGPLGKYKAGFTDNTEKLAEIIANLTQTNGLESILGGGDTLAAINLKELDHKFSFISTGGGAMLDFLVNETLPGIESLKN